MNALAALSDTVVKARLSYSPGGKSMLDAFFMGKRIILSTMLIMRMALDKRKAGFRRSDVLKRLRREDLSSSSSWEAAVLLSEDTSPELGREDAAASGALRRDAAPLMPAEELGIVSSIMV